MALPIGFCLRTCEKICVTDMQHGAGNRLGKYLIQWWAQFWFLSPCPALETIPEPHRHVTDSLFFHFHLDFRWFYAFIIIYPSFSHALVTTPTSATGIFQHAMSTVASQKHQVWVDFASLPPPAGWPIACIENNPPFIWQGLVNAPFWGFWTSPSIVGWCSIGTCTNPCMGVS